MEKFGVTTLAVGFGEGPKGVGDGWWYQPEDPTVGIPSGGWVHDCEEDDGAFDPIKVERMVPISLDRDGRCVRRVGVVQAECLCGARLITLVEEVDSDWEAIQAEQDQAWAEELIADVASSAAQRQWEMDGGVLAQVDAEVRL